MSIYKMKMDKCLNKLLKKSKEVDSRTFKLNSENEEIEGETYEIDITYWYWGPFHSSDQVLKNQTKKKDSF